MPSVTGHGPLVKTLPVYITKHVVLEKPVPVPEPVYIEKPYHIPVEKVIPVPIEKIIHKPVPVPVPVPQVTVKRFYKNNDNTIVLINLTNLRYTREGNII